MDYSIRRMFLNLFINHYIYKNESMIIRLHTPFIDIYLLF